MSMITACTTSVCTMLAGPLTPSMMSILQEAEDDHAPLQRDAQEGLQLPGEGVELDDEADGARARAAHGRERGQELRHVAVADEAEYDGLLRLIVVGRLLSAAAVVVAGGGRRAQARGPADDGDDASDRGGDAGAEHDGGERWCAEHQCLRRACPAPDRHAQQRNHRHEQGKPWRRGASCRDESGCPRASVRRNVGGCLATSFTDFKFCISLSKLRKNRTINLTACW